MALRIILLILFSRNLLPFFCQGQDMPSEKISGKWQTDISASMEGMGGEDRKKYEMLPGELKDRLYRSMASRVYEFGEDGTFSAGWEYGGKPRFTSGSWELRGKHRLAILLPSGGSFYRIIRPSGQKLVLEPEIASGSSPQTLYFFKKEP